MKRFGHSSTAQLENMVKRNQIADVKIDGKESFCDALSRQEQFTKQHLSRMELSKG
jgi:hypothetical protein